MGQHLPLLVPDGSGLKVGPAKIQSRGGEAGFMNPKSPCGPLAPNTGIIGCMAAGDLRKPCFYVVACALCGDFGVSFPLAGAMFAAGKIQVLPGRACGNL